MEYQLSLALALAGSILLIGQESAAAKTCVQQSIQTELLDGAEYCASSHLKAQGAGHYNPGNASTMNARGGSGAWCEGAKGPGIGEWISVEIVPKIPVRTLMIVNGYQKVGASPKKSRRAFSRNGRIRDVLIEHNSGMPFEATFEDTMGEQEIRLPGWVEAGVIRLTILSVYPGSHYSDTCLTLMWPDLEEQREMEWKEQN